MSETQSRVRFKIAYDGTGFSGWAAQPGLRTVQGVIEEALAMVLRSDPISITVAGRTDAGVHASGQVAHADIPDTALAAVSGGAAGLAGRLNRVFGADADVMVLETEAVDSAFDARFSATWRRYEYRIADGATVPNPLLRHSRVSVPAELDLARMQEFSTALLGLGDFATFCKPRPEATTIRELQAFEWRREADSTVVAELRADAFCHSMVRALVGAAVAVGSGRMTVERALELRELRERSSEFVVMPPHGLVLVEVGYPEPSEWAERAERIRAKRTEDELETGD